MFERERERETDLCRFEENDIIEFLTFSHVFSYFVFFNISFYLKLLS